MLPPLLEVVNREGPPEKIVVVFEESGEQLVREHNLLLEVLDPQIVIIGDGDREPVSLHLPEDRDLLLAQVIHMLSTEDTPEFLHRRKDAAFGQESACDLAGRGTGDNLEEGSRIIRYFGGGADQLTIEL